jgi:hypothetical protein
MRQVKQRRRASACKIDDGNFSSLVQVAGKDNLVGKPYLAGDVAREGEIKS